MCRFFFIKQNRDMIQSLQVCLLPDVCILSLVLVMITEVKFHH